MKNSIYILLISLFALNGCTPVEDNVNLTDPINEGLDWPQFRGNNANTGYSDDSAPEKLPKSYLDSDEFTSNINYAGRGFVGTPAVVDGVIYLVTKSGISTSSYHVVAINLKTGEEKWKFSSEYMINSNPAISGGKLFIGNNDGNLYALDVNTGLEKWKFETSQNITSSPKISQGLVFFGSGDGFSYAVDVNSGNEKWKFKNGFDGTPSVVNDLILLRSDGHLLYAVDINTGKEKWRFQTERGGPSICAIADETIFFTTSGDASPSYCYAIDMKTGQEKWKIKLKHFTAIEASPSVAYGMVFISTYDGILYAFDMKTGQEKWNVNTGGGGVQANSPAVANNMVFIGGIDGYLYAFDVNNGQVRWKYGSGYGSYNFSGPIVSNGMLFYEQSGYLKVLK